MLKRHLRCKSKAAGYVWYINLIQGNPENGQTSIRLIAAHFLMSVRRVLDLQSLVVLRREITDGFALACVCSTLSFARTCLVCTSPLIGCLVSSSMQCQHALDHDADARTRVDEPHFISFRLSLPPFLTSSWISDNRQQAPGVANS